MLDLLLLAAFIFVEIVGIRFSISVVRVLLITLLSSLIIGYFIALPLGLNQLIVFIGHSSKVAIVNSWILMSEYLRSQFTQWHHYFCF